MSQPVGLWLIGARGGVATVAAIGLAALKKNASSPVGLVTSLPAFENLGLADFADIVIGGHDIRDTSLVDEARQFQETSRAIPAHLVDLVSDELNEIDRRIRPGLLHHCGNAIDRLASSEIVSDSRSAAQKVAQVKTDLEEFRSGNNLSRVIVINVASTEVPVDAASLPNSWQKAESNLEQFPVSSLYAIAAMQTGCGYINFTPSLGSNCDALNDLAIQSGTPHAGRDGKTGETLLKSVLAPMFAIRNLNVMSWVGHNIFGNMDGQVLDDPENKKTKVESKDRLLGEILGYSPQSHISIEYIKSLGDWKTAWDHIHFQGFLGTPMVMQFTWQGCDSILAAPLILDLFRLTDRAMSGGEAGLLEWLACFFKSPAGVCENNLVHQYSLLQQWVAEQSG